jgi:hypothetical protein
VVDKVRYRYAVDCSELRAVVDEVWLQMYISDGDQSLKKHNLS